MFAKLISHSSMRALEVQPELHTLAGIRCKPVVHLPKVVSQVKQQP